MFVDVSLYRNLTVCVAVSGGRDSMALLHYLSAHAQDDAFRLCAVHCDHRMRQNSQDDAAFVKAFCSERRIPLLIYTADKPLTSEESARNWRLACFADASRVKADGLEWQGFDVLCKAHHADDNAETVLFRLARGTGLSGAAGIATRSVMQQSVSFRVDDPFLSVTRQEIDAYVAQNGLSYREDESNASDDYDRNVIRHHVLPVLKAICPQAVEHISAFAERCTEDEDYLMRTARSYVQEDPLRPYRRDILFCEEKVLFKRAVLSVLKEWHERDYTAEQLQRLYALQRERVGVQYAFLDIVVYRKTDKLIFIRRRDKREEVIPFDRADGRTWNGQPFRLDNAFDRAEERGYKTLVFDRATIPSDAVVRYRRSGDVITKFGGGTKPLGEFLNDKKVPVWERDFIPVVATGHTVWLAGGVEISDAVKVTEWTKEQDRQSLTCFDRVEYIK